MANVFDQFDAAPAGVEAPPVGNPFDQFDPPARSTRPGNEPTTVPNPFAGGDPERATFGERFAGSPMSRRGEMEGALGEGLRRQADERLIGEPSAANAALAAGLRFSNDLGLNLSRNAAAGLATAAGKVGVPGFSDKPFDQNYQLARDQEDALARQNPKSALAGTVGGIGAGMVFLPALGGASTLARRAGQAALTGAGYGAAAEFADTKDLGRTATAGAIGGTLGAVAQPIAEKAVGVIAGLTAKGFPSRNQAGELTTTAKAMLSRAGVDPAAIDAQLDDAISATFSRKGVSEATAREAAAGEFGIPLTRGQATQDAAQLRLEQELASGRRGEKAQKAAGEFFEEQRQAIDTARQGIGQRLTGGEGRVATPLEAGELVAGRLRGAAADARTIEAQALGQADEALRGVRGGTGDVIDAATTVSAAVRDRAAQAKAGYRQAYDDVAKIEGEFAPGALDRMGSRVRDRLGPEYPVDEVLTPGATRALADLDNLPGLFKTEEGAGPTLQQLDQVRKRIVAYRGSTGQNTTDRRAIDRILGEMDAVAEDAAAAGLFGARAPRVPADDFPGNAALEGVQVAQPSARERAPESLVQWLGREGGIKLDGDARAGDLQRIQTGYGPLARQNGRSLDELRPRLISEGYLPPDADGGVARNVTDEVMELIRRERAGDRTYRAQDQERGASIMGNRLRGADEHFAELVDDASSRIRGDLEAVGFRPRDVDPDTLREASESIVRGQHHDPFDAYEAAVMTRAGSGKSGTVPDIPFDGATSVPTTTALAGGTTEPVEAMRRARGAFADYQKTFKPQGTGDDVGRAMQRIVERDASAGDVASMLYGAGKIGNSKLQIDLADRLKGMVGADSEAWSGLQQGLIAKIVGTGGDHAAISTRIQDALTGQSRQFTLNVLSHEQVEGLRAFQKATERARQVRESVPQWVTDLDRQGFEPQKVIENLFGRTTTTSNMVAKQYADGVRKLFGDGSAEWSALRQAGWQKLTEDTNLTGKELALRIWDFTSGKGKAVARALYSEEERALMNRFAGQLQAAQAPAGTKGLPRQEPWMDRLAKRGPELALNAVLGALGYTVAGPYAAGAAIGANWGRKLFGDARSVRMVREFERGAPRVQENSPQFDARRFGVGGGLVAEQLE